MNKLIFLLVMIFCLTGCFNLNHSSRYASANPQSKQWMDKLYEGLTLENLAVAQYTEHSQKFNAMMPYRMIINQEYRHVDWISSLLTVHGAKTTKYHRPIKEAKSLQEALTIDKGLEEEQIPLYKWLVQNSKDPKDTATLNRVLMQTEHHYQMFNHALQMPGGMHMGPRMMK